MSKVSAMKNKRTTRTSKEANFKTHKNDHNFGHNAARKQKQSEKLLGWGE